MLTNSIRVKGPKGEMEYYERMVKETEEREKKYPGMEKWALELASYKKRLFSSTNPAARPNEATVLEIEALAHLRMSNCASTPHLLAYGKDTLDEGIDEQGMVGGFVRFILMTKVPGRRLTVKEFQNFDLCQRDEIREAFKKALM